eukprot:6545941-Pyramimonas_sp.AAC.1
MVGKNPYRQALFGEVQKNAKEARHRVSLGLPPRFSGEPRGGVRRGGPSRKARKFQGLLRSLLSLHRRHRSLLGRPEGFE